MNWSKYIGYYNWQGLGHRFTEWMTSITIFTSLNPPSPTHEIDIGYIPVIPLLKSSADGKNMWVL